MKGDARAKGCVLMPLRAGTKQPMFAHKKEGEWSWERSDAYAEEHPGHESWGLLLDGLVAVDCDDEAAVAWVESQEDAETKAALTRCAVQETRKGRHYVFYRPSWADAEGYWDGARQKGELAVDVKTRCSTGTRGLLTVAPSKDKRWQAGRAPWEIGELPEMPRALLEKVGERKAVRKTVARKAKERSEASVEEASVEETQEGQKEEEGAVVSMEAAQVALSKGGNELNTMFDLDPSCTWECSPSDKSYKLMPTNCRACLVKRGYMHTDAGHSCVFVNLDVSTGGATGVVTSCYSHGMVGMTGASKARLMEYMARLGLVKNECSGGGKETAFARLRDVVLAHASGRRLKKQGHHVWRPVEGCPCAYEQAEDYKEYLNTVLRRSAEYNAKPQMHRELLEYLRNYDPEAFPNLTRDQDLVSFADGVLELSTDRFEAYPVAEEQRKRVARHHIAQPVGSAPEDAPLFEGVLNAQMSGEMAELMYVMMGRLLFPVRCMDAWQVMPYLVGIAGTGKSLVLDIIAAMFAPSCVSALSGTQERKFGLEGKYDKEVIIGRDLPQALSGVLEATLLQSMVSGEAVSVAAKGKVAIEVQAWRVPMVMASNYKPDYLDSAGQISRRIAAFEFRSAVRRPDPTLTERILKQELPTIMRKALRAYRAAVELHGNEGFFTWCPQEMRDAQRAVQLETDYVRRFLMAGPEDNASKSTRIYVVQRAGATTGMTAFKDAFRKYMKFKHATVNWKFDETNHMPFEELGYEVRKVQKCKACGKKAKGGDERCCLNYSTANRVKHVSIMNMEVVSEFADWRGEWVNDAIGASNAGCDADLS